MHQHAANASVATPAPAKTAINPLPVAIAEATATPTLRDRGGQRANWNRVTIRLPAGELAKINDVVIATQQAIRSSKVTTTDILRIGLRRVQDQEAISTAEIQALRAADARFTKDKTV